MTKQFDRSTLPEDVARLAARVVAAAPNRYPDVEAVIRAGVQAIERAERRRAEKEDALRAALVEGQASGIAPDDVFARVSATLNLSPLARR